MKTLTLIKTLISQKSYTKALQSSLSLTPFLTDQIYSLFIKSGSFLYPSLSTSLISHFSKLNNLTKAFNFFLDTPNPDLITYNALISGFSKSGNCHSTFVFELFHELRLVGLVPDVYTLSSLIKGCDSLIENGVSHGVCVKLGLECKGFIVSGLIENYAKNGDVCSAEMCFYECSDADNVVCTALICGFMWNDHFDKGKEVFVGVRRLGLEYNEFSLNGVLGCLFDVREGGQVHGFSVKRGYLYGSSMHLCNAVLSMYLRCGCIDDAIKVFDEIPQPDVVSWTERIAAAIDGDEAMECFGILHSEGFDANEYSLINVLSAFGEVRFLKAGKQIHALCNKLGCLEVVSVGNALVSMYGKCGELHDARCVFNDMIYRDSVSWNSLMAACSDSGCASEALDIFFHMCDLALQPTVYTLASILETVSRLGFLKYVVQIHSHLIKCGFMLDDSLVCGLIIAYGRCDGTDESKMIFSEIDKINLVHLNAMMTNLVHGGCQADALALFRTAWSSSLEMDGKTLSIILKACGAMTDMEQGRTIHSLSLKSGFDQESFVQSALVDIYCKCGSIGEAEKAFFDASTDNLAARNAMLMGYAQHGCCHDVFRIFDELCQTGLEPDEITYLGLLTSCCHVGLVNQARYYLKSMSEHHGIIPRLEHYACVVDLLGRLGLLEDAKEMIDHMPVQPDVHIWQILLSACSIHRHVELGRFAASKLLELQPENESAYVLLSNLYASMGMWNAVGTLRKEMKQKVLHKEPGSSWIQVGGRIHTFSVDDISHSQNIEIQVELAKLYTHTLTMPELEQDDVSLWIYAF